MDEKTTDRRFISLKLKWAIGTAVGSLLIFLIVAMAMFSSFTQRLYDEERGLLNHGMINISRQLGQLNQPLTKRNVQSALVQHITGAAQYQRPIIQDLSDGHLIVKVYNRRQQPILTTGHHMVPVTLTKHRQVRLVNGPDHKVIIGQMPIYTRQDHQLVGYLQVENKLNAYYRNYRQLRLVMILALCLVLLASGILGYLLSMLFLRPLSDIHDTVKVISKDPTKNVRVPVPNHNDEMTELTTMFNGMLDQTQRYIKQQSQFVNDVSHELRTPITIIQGHLDMLQRWGKDDPKVLNDSINASLVETERMKNLVQEMIDLSRAEQVDINFRNQKTVVNDVVHQVYNNLRELYPDFVFILDDDLDKPITANIYRDHLEQVLVILCDNAVKYSSDRKEVHLSLSRGMNTVEIGIQDFGVGIPPEDIDRVFDRFYRVDKARSRKKGGNGLGLSIAKRLVEGYHGSITLESSLGAGSIFRIILPIVGDPEAIN